MDSRVKVEIRGNLARGISERTYYFIHRYKKIPAADSWLSFTTFQRRTAGTKKSLRLRGFEFWTVKLNNHGTLGSPKGIPIMKSTESSQKLSHRHRDPTQHTRGVLYASYAAAGFCLASEPHRCCAPLFPSLPPSLLLPSRGCE